MFVYHDIVWAGRSCAREPPQLDLNADGMIASCTQGMNSKWQPGGRLRDVQRHGVEFLLCSKTPFKLAQVRNLAGSPG